MFCNPLEYRSISVEKATRIDSNHVIVVYRKKEDQSVERRVVQGPAIFVPEAEEWQVEVMVHMTYSIIGYTSLNGMARTLRTRLV